MGVWGWIAVGAVAGWMALLVFVVCLCMARARPHPKVVRNPMADHPRRGDRIQP